MKEEATWMTVATDRQPHARGTVDVCSSAHEKFTQAAEATA